MSLAELAGTDYVCIVQLTDSHLFAADSDDLLGLDTLDSLNSVVDLVLSEIARMDLVLATGDIAQDASELAYRRFIEASLQLPAPCHWIPGNHDDAAMMQRLGAASGMSQDWVDIGSWRIVLLDSIVICWSVCITIRSTSAVAGCSLLVCAMRTLFLLV